MFFPPFLNHYVADCVPLFRIFYKPNPCYHNVFVEKKNKLYLFKLFQLSWMQCHLLFFIKNIYLPNFKTWYYKGDLYLSFYYVMVYKTLELKVSWSYLVESDCKRTIFFQINPNVILNTSWLTCLHEMIQIFSVSLTFTPAPTTFTPLTASITAQTSQSPDSSLMKGFICSWL